MKENLRSYKKLLYALNEFPESTIVTLDDDHIYAKNMLALLCKDRKEKEVRCYNCVSILVSASSKEVLAFNNKAKGNILRNVTYGHGGVIWPKGCFVDSIFNQEAFLKVIPTDDDFWFAMCLKQEYSIQKASYLVYLQDEGSVGLLFFNDNPLVFDKDETYVYRKDVNLHKALDYFGWYEKYNILPNPDVLKYLESLHQNQM